MGIVLRMKKPLTGLHKPEKEDVSIYETRVHGNQKTSDPLRSTRVITYVFKVCEGGEMSWRRYVEIA